MREKYITMCKRMVVKERERDMRVPGERERERSRTIL